MKTSHKLFLASAATLPLVGLAGTVAYAQTSATDGAQNLVQKIASKFNLKEADVRAVFEEERAAREAEIQSKVSEALKTAGFTDQQIADLQAKKTEQRDAMKAWRDANPNATRDEIKAQHNKEKTEFEAWAKEKGIDLTKVRDTLKDVMPMGRGHRGLGMMENGGTPPADAPTN